MTYSKKLLAGLVLVFAFSSVKIKSMDLLSPEITRTVEGTAIGIVVELIMQLSYGEEPTDKSSNAFKDYKLYKDSYTVLIKTAIDPLFAGHLTSNLTATDPRKYVIDGLFQGAKTVGTKIIQTTTKTHKRPDKITKEQTTTPMLEIPKTEPTDWAKAVENAVEAEKEKTAQCPALSQTPSNPDKPYEEASNSYWSMFVGAYNGVYNTVSQYASSTAEWTSAAATAAITKISEKFPEWSNVAFSCALSWIIYKIVQLLVAQFSPSQLMCAATGGIILAPICSTIVDRFLEYIARQTGLIGTSYIIDTVKSVISYTLGYLQPAVNALVAEEKKAGENLIEGAGGLVDNAQKIVEKEPDQFVIKAITEEEKALKNNKDSKE